MSSTACHPQSLSIPQKHVSNDKSKTLIFSKLVIDYNKAIFYSKGLGGIIHVDPQKRHKKGDRAIAFIIVSQKA